MNSISKIIGLFVAFFAMSAWAITLQDHMIRGEVVSVDEAEKNLEVQILETGDKVVAETGKVVTFEIPENVSVEMDIDDRLYQPYVAFSFGDLRRGDTVLIEFQDDENLEDMTLLRVEDPSEDIRVRTLEEGILIEETGG